MIFICQSIILIFNVSRRDFGVFCLAIWLVFFSLFEEAGGGTDS